MSFQKDNEMAIKIAEKVKEKGGRTFYVGGLVRDELLGKENKDIDIEIHGVEFNDLKDILTDLGHIDERKVGDNFGILALKGYDIDIAMPRSEKPTGDGGHKDFIIETDPFIGYENAAKRRDFTINAMMKDVLSGEVLDYYGGLDDLKNGVIRHVDDDTFKDDPLRVLRAAQFASRFNFSIADETVELSKKMDLSQLSRERIAGELDKALLKSDKPSVFFNELNKMKQLDTWFPEVKALMDCEQSPLHHPEGNVYNHTMMVLDEAAKCRKESSNPRYFMVSTLCHDFGKPETTAFNEEKGRVMALGHETAGVSVASGFIKRVYNENDMNKYVKNLVELHMEPLRMTSNEKTSNKSYMKLYDKCVAPEDLILLSRCDNLGKGNPADYTLKEQLLREKLGTYKELMAKPHVTGQDLIKCGCKPGPEFSEMLRYAHNCRLSGLDKDITMRQMSGEFSELRKNIIQQTLNKAENLPDATDDIQKNV